MQVLCDGFVVGRRESGGIMGVAIGKLEAQR